MTVLTPALVAQLLDAFEARQRERQSQGYCRCGARIEHHVAPPQKPSHNSPQKRPYRLA